MEQNNGGFPRIRRLIAHRRLWFQYAGPEITSSQLASTRTNVSTWSRQHESRYLDHTDGQRASIVLFDIVARINLYNAQAIEMYGKGASHEEVEAQLGRPLLNPLRDSAWTNFRDLN